MQIQSLLMSQYVEETGFTSSPMDNRCDKDEAPLFFGGARVHSFYKAKMFHLGPHLDVDCINTHTASSHWAWRQNL